MSKAVPRGFLAGSLMVLSAAAVVAGAQLAFGALPLPQLLHIPSEAPELPGWTPHPRLTLPSASSQLQSRGQLRRWHYTASDRSQTMDLTLVPIRVRNRLDLNLQQITNHDSALKALTLANVHEYTTTGDHNLHLAIGKLSGQHQPRAIQTCVVPPSSGKTRGSSGIRYQQLAQAITAQNNRLSGGGLIGWISRGLGLRRGERWSCILLTVHASGSSDLPDSSLIKTTKRIVEDLIHRPN